MKAEINKQSNQVMIQQSQLVKMPNGQIIQQMILKPGPPIRILQPNQVTSGTGAESDLTKSEMNQTKTENNNNHNNRDLMSPPCNTVKLPPSPGGRSNISTHSNNSEFKRELSANTSTMVKREAVGNCGSPFSIPASLAGPGVASPVMIQSPPNQQHFIRGPSPVTRGITPPQAVNTSLQDEWYSRQGLQLQRNVSKKGKQAKKAKRQKDKESEKLKKKPARKWDFVMGSKGGGGNFGQKVENSKNLLPIEFTTKFFRLIVCEMIFSYHIAVFATAET